MKTQEELKELREEYESLSTKLKELTQEELSMVTGGNEGHQAKTPPQYYPGDDYQEYLKKVEEYSQYMKNLFNNR